MDRSHSNDFSFVAFSVVLFGIIGPSTMLHSHEITRLLQAWSRGDSQALAKLIPLVDHELKKIAHAYMSDERADNVLQTTALVHEALIRLMEGQQIDWQNRTHFYSLVARRMRQILIDYARQQLAARRGNRPERLDVDEVKLMSVEGSQEILMLHEALLKLAAIDDRKSKIVEYRYFGGFTLEEIAVMLTVSESTVDREWRLARAWLLRELQSQTDSVPHQL
jgi:RNA polymerase sigma factor (TIGR02999 family)